MSPRHLYSLALPILLLAVSVPLSKSVGQPPEQQADEAELMAVAGLSTILPRDGDIVRYVLRRGYEYHRDQPGARSNWPRAQIVQVHWPYKTDHPQVLLIELERTANNWRITKRRQASMDSSRYPQLIGNLVGAASVIGPNPDRGTMMVCSHADSSRLEISLPDQQQLRLTRTAHCSHDAPAFVAGDLLTASVELSLRLDRSPQD